MRARIEREQWSVAIHPAGVEMKGRVVFGSREAAELQAREMIDRWLKILVVILTGALAGYLVFFVCRLKSKLTTINAP